MNDEQKNCELGTLEALHLKVVEVSPDANVVVNDKGEIIIFNPQAEFLFGYDRSEVLGKTIEMLIPKNLREVHKAHRSSYLEVPRTREMMCVEGLHKKGYNIPIEVELAPIIVPNAGVHVLAVVRRSKREQPKVVADSQNV